MYLSDRKRRAYYSLPLPQNLYPKKLSLKDRRFLQKGDKRQKSIHNSGILSFCVHKGLQVLYEKHIQKTYTSKTPVYLQVWKKNQKMYTQHSVSRHTSGTAIQSTPLSMSRTKHGEVLPLLSTFYPQGGDAQRGNIFVVQKKRNYKKVEYYNSGSTNLHTPKVPKQEPGCFPYAKSPLPVPKGGEEGPIFGENYKKKNHIGPCIPLIAGSQHAPVSTSLCVYVQTIKTPDTLHQNTFGYSSLANVLHKRKEVFIPDSKSYHREDHIIKNGLLRCLFEQQAQRTFDICKTLASPPLFVNGKNKYLYCRYLYNVEHLKNGLNSQMMQNQNNTKGQKKAYHEKKKIALFYGQIAKKDMVRLCKNAQTLPGLFFDNMYTLLESRVDVCVYRAGFSNTIASARQQIRNGCFERNGKSLLSSKILNKPGDLLSYKCLPEPRKDTILKKVYKRTTKTLYKLWCDTDPKAVGILQKYLFYTQNTKPTANVTHLPQFLFLNKHVSYAPDTVRALALEKPVLQICKFAHLFALGFFLYKNLCNISAFFTAQSKGHRTVLSEKAAQKYFGGISLEKKVLRPVSGDFYNLSQPRKRQTLVLGVNKNTKKCYTSENTKVLGTFKNNIVKTYTGNSDTGAKPQLSYNRKQTQQTCSGTLKIHDINGEFFYNVYSAALLKHNVKKRRLFAITVNKVRFLNAFKKNLHNVNTASTWGQKPLHLEISHKTCSVIYLYRPQKIISSLCLDFDALKM